MIRENPNTYHINIGLRIGDRIRLLEPTNLIPSEVKSGPLLLSLRQYLALDLTNHAVASRNKDAQQAKDLLIRARRLDPSSIFPLPNLASALTGLNETDKALEVLDSSLKLNPNAAISYFMKGIIFHKQGKKEEAMAAYSRSLELNGSDYEIYLYRGDLFQWMEKYKDGDRDYTNALRLAPNNAGKKLTEHVSDILTKKWEDPSTKKIHIQILNETKMEPVYVETLFYLASLYWRANQEEFTFDLLKEFAQHLRPVRNSLKLKNQEFSPEVLKFLENLYQLFPPALWQRYEIKPLWDSLELPFK
jgi:tetratricopeptide (TPR) repeat protein